MLVFDHSMMFVAMGDGDPVAYLNERDTRNRTLFGDKLRRTMVNKYISTEIRRLDCFASDAHNGSHIRRSGRVGPTVLRSDVVKLYPIHSRESRSKGTTSTSNTSFQVSRTLDLAVMVTHHPFSLSM